METPAIHIHLSIFFSGYAYKFEDLDTDSAVSSKKKDDITTKDFEIKDEDEVLKDVRNNDFEDQNEQKNINHKAQDESDLNDDDDQSDDKDQKNTFLEDQNDLEDENNLPNDPSDRDSKFLNYQRDGTTSSSGWEYFT